MKVQLLVSLDNQVIYGLSCDKSKTHDFQLFKNSKMKIPEKNQANRRLWLSMNKSDSR